MNGGGGARRLECLMQKGGRESIRFGNTSDLSVGEVASVWDLSDIEVGEAVGYRLDSRAQIGASDWMRHKLTNEFLMVFF
ncbi:hypothetical protein WJ98_19170 [Burkholderia ubonensis]|nr:hypothetical protein WJ98_19170 [Burkholderia ubonensis]